MGAFVRRISPALVLFFVVFLFPATVQATPPAAVTLSTPELAEPHSLTLNWTASDDAGFQEYRLYRSTSAGVDTNDVLITTESSPGTTSFTDDTLRIKSTYYYKIYVVNTLGEVSAGSNEVSRTTSGNSYPFFDDMESGDANWITSTGTWELTDEDAYSGTYSFTDSPGLPYQSNADNKLVMAISLTGNDIRMPVLSFYHKFNFQANVDQGLLEISTDGGNSYFIAYSTTGFSSSNWAFDNIDLTPYLGQEIYIRFRVKTDGSTNSDGWHIDDVRIDESEMTTDIPFPFTEDFSDSARSDSLWQTSCWGWTSGEYMHSRPNGNYHEDYYYLTYTWLTTAANIDLAGTVSPILVFKQYRYDTRNNFLVQLSADNGATYTTIASYDGNTGWTTSQVSIASYAGLKVRLRFYVNGQYSNAYWLIDNIRITEEPTDVVIASAVNQGRHGVQLSWSQNTDGDFQRYEIYRSTSSGISRSGSPYAIITSSSTTSLLDSLLTYQNTRYYYRIFVVDTTGDYSYGSNEVSVLTPTWPAAASYPFFDDMESGAGYFAEDQPWSITAEDSDTTARSGLHCWSDSPNGPYGASTSRSLYLPVSLGGAAAHRPMLTFMQKYSFQQNYDHGLVEISTNNGSSFFIAYSITGFSEGWEPVEVDLTPYVGQSILLRFRIVSNEDTNSDGWYVDDIRIDEDPVSAVEPFPFFEDFNDAVRSDSIWINSTWGLASSGHDGSTYMHSRPAGNYHNDYYYLTYTWISTAGSIDLSGTTSPILTFWQARNDIRNNFLLQVSSDNGATYETVGTYDGSTGWTRNQISLANYAGKTIRLRFYLNGSYWDGYWLIDDIAITEEPLDVVMNQPETVGRHDVVLSWSKNEEGDFKQYELYKSTSSGVSRSGSPLQTYIDPNQVSYHDEQLVYPNQTYYYRAFVVDTSGNVSYGSNEISVRTPGLPEANSYPFFDDMEHGPDAYAEELPWKITEESSFSGTHSWSDSPNGPYATNTSRSLLIPISLTGPSISMPMLSFAHRYNFQSSYDQGLVEISINGGTNYTLIYSTTGFSGANWDRENIDLTTYLGQNILLRFRVVSDGGTNSDGWYIDDIRVNESRKTEPLEYPFTDDFNDFARSDSVWITSTWGPAPSGHDGSQYMHSRPKGNYLNDYYYLTYTWITTANNIDLSDAINPKLTFWQARNDNRNNYVVQGSSDDGVTYVTLASYDGNTGWTRNEISLVSFAGMKMRLRFLVNGLYWDGYWLIDDVSVHEDYTGISLPDFVRTIGPELASTTLGLPTEPVRALVYENGVTNGAGQGAGILADVGYGPEGSLPGLQWVWTEAIYDGSAMTDSADVYRAALSAPELGQYSYAFRFSTDGGSHWLYSDLDGNNTGSGGDNFYSPIRAGTFLVTMRPVLVLRDSVINMTLPANHTGSRVVSFFNDGEGPLGVQFADTSEWLTLNPTTLTVQPQEFGRLNLLFDTQDLPDDSTYLATVHWTSNDPDRRVDSLAVNLTVVDSAAVVLAGFARDHRTGSGVSWAKMNVYHADTLFMELTTGGDGYFAIYGASAGDFEVQASARGYYPAKAILTAPGDNASIDLSSVHQTTFSQQSLNIYGTASFFAGEALRAGDVVSVRDPDGVLCGIFQVREGGHYGFLHVYADDPTTVNIDEGAEAGDALSFYVNDYPAEVLGPDPAVWTGDGDVLNIDITAERKDLVALSPGWNLVSFTSIPADNTVGVVLAELSTNLILVTGFDMDWNDGGPPGARTYDPALPEPSDLDVLSPKRGYWIKVTLADSFVVQGEKVYDDTWLPLDLGWNLVSYLPENAMSVEQALESIHGMFAVVSGYDQSAMMFLPGSPFNDLEAMANGFGYWIRLNERASLNYRSDAGVMLSPPMTVFEDTPVATAAVDFTPTPLWADYYGEVDLPIGKVIEAYDADGVLCGRTTLRATQQYGFLHVYGDDANTPEDEGALPGDHITFMCDGEIIGSTSVRHGWSPGQDPQHVPLGAFSSAEETKDGLPIAYELSPNFPNPFNNSTTIRYQLPDGGKVSLQVFNLLGQKVATLVQQEMPAGYHQFVWRGAGMASGIYFLRFSVIDANGVERFRRVRKIMLLE